MHGIVIPAVEHILPHVTRVQGYRDIQSVVRGPFESIEMEDPNFEMLVNEEGKLTLLPTNRRATLLMYVHNPKLAERDIICGDALLVGPTDHMGEGTDIPQEIADLILGRQLFDIQMPDDDPDTIKTVEHGFTNWTNAYAAVVRLRRHYDRDFKVIPA
ncbi:DUF3846 domain-containing protein [Naasia lichenicola]|uniref:DUF3846 domain-containing protein n=1 Tax=Naasia lichenicola TaxID=2565933 RepID=A0A4S4FJV5_9MICO|nr:DUF3846 domain-containing protein [Naasia lichenicola]THG30703.1 DUF3846 domain-containing protein [Naasia lichenicola]THG31940.1 DUF3846 domain-containing protein [Naasia lichenicola]